MKGLGALLAKEWSHHKWLLFVHWGIAIFTFGLIAAYTEQAPLLSRGFLSLAMMCWPWFAFVIAHSLSHRVFTLEQRARTENFLSGLPVFRWHSLLGKLLFTFGGLCLVCFFYFFCVAIVSPQARLNSWQAVAFPVTRLVVFNFSFSAIIFLTGMSGKFRWYIYMIAAFFLLLPGLNGTSVAALIGETPPLLLVEEERALADLDALPWNRISQNLVIGTIAVFLIFSSDLLIRYWKVDNITSGTAGFSDRLAIGTGVVAILVLFWMGLDDEAPSEFNLEYHMAFEKDAEVSSGETLVQLSYYKQKPANLEEQEQDRKMIEEMARVLEAARVKLEAHGWPKPWLLVKSPDASGEGKSWAKRMSGDTLIFVADWDCKTREERESLTKTLARWNLDFYIDSRTFSPRHLDKHGWITSGLGPLLLSQTSESYRKHFDGSKAKSQSELELLEVDSLTRWSKVAAEATKQSKNGRNLSYTVLREAEDRLSEDQFTAWLREVADHCLTKPNQSTVFSIKKGPLFWRALLFDSTAAVERRGLDINELVTAVRQNDR